ncbi:TIGR03899 family protein [Colwellia sp. D2M02]|uniref:TIGR03899 family protein n=1 Tax=Colwellia sp. D2M02 TaxID=2841562 RepID=UPI001C09E16E|nr:TIGR03899 family protein [Colwellia sp. D2M02]MBU2892136.1 TIGR03899 family protein [Colwellia sp. D2M02]
METEKKTVIVTKEDSPTDVIEAPTTPNSNGKNSETSASQRLTKLAKHFVIDGTLQPLEKQMPIEDRTSKRNRLEHLRKQKNIEAIVEKSLAYCANSDVKHKADNDWFSRYITLAEEVSNPTMQDLWAKILAGELTKPGSFSYKALKVFRDMSIYDAKLLAKASALAIKDQSKRNIRLISGCYQKPGLLNFFSSHRLQHVNLSHYGLNHADLLALAENHLLYTQESESNAMAQNEAIIFTYNGLPLKISAKKANVVLQFYKLTPLGAELAHLISDKPNEEFFNYLKKQLSHHFNVSSD